MIGRVINASFQIGPGFEVTGPCEDKSSESRSDSRSIVGESTLNKTSTLIQLALVQIIVRMGIKRHSPAVKRSAAKTISEILNALRKQHKYAH